MSKALIKLLYKQIINAESKGNFEKNILNVSYNEFLLKSQAYNIEKKFSTFKEMVRNDGRANSLHYKLSFPVIPLVEFLDKKIPYLTDNAGKNILFDSWQFELIDSDVSNKLMHAVAINYSIEVLTLLESFGEYMLLAKGDCSEILSDNLDCFVLKMKDELSITMYQQLPEPAHI